MGNLSLRYIKKFHTPPDSIVATVDYLAPYVTKLLLFFYPKITANQVTFFSFLFVFIPAPLIALGNYWMVLLGAFLLQFLIVLDCSDGAIARIKKTMAQFGGYYAGFVHDFIPPILMIALSINSYRFFDNPWLLVVGSITVVAMFLTNYGRIAKDRVAVKYMLRHGKILKSDQKFEWISVKGNEDELQFKTKTQSTGSYVENIIGRFKSVSRIIRVFNSFSNLFFIILLLAVFNLTHYAILFYAPFYVLIFFVKVYIEVKKGMSEYRFE